MQIKINKEKYHQLLSSWNTRSWQCQPGGRYTIEREETYDVTGNVSRIRVWETYCSYNSKKDRDSALAQLIKQYPQHNYRANTRTDLIARLAS